eukprot:COSAG02_NODE_5893_length_3956_cov_15.470832_4_plen_53_part_00
MAGTSTIIVALRSAKDSNRPDLVRLTAIATPLYYSTSSYLVTQSRTIYRNSH